MSDLPCASIGKTTWNRDVYEPSDDSFLLVDALQQHAATWRQRRPRLVVEIGSGSGYVICSIALMLKALGQSTHVCAVDHSHAAITATMATLQSHEVLAGVELVMADLLNGLQGMMGHVDILVFNPPYVPTPDEEVSRGGVATAWAGGYRGRRVIDRVLEQLQNILAPGGELFMVTVTENDPRGIIKEMEQKGFTGDVVLSRQADEETLSIVRLVKTYPAPA